MSTQSSRTRAFLSHSWKDKSLARRVSRRLGYRGIEVWLDEQGMQVSDRLSQSIRDAIRDSTHFLLLWTDAAAVSDWVAKELEFVQSAEQPPAIVPLLGDPAVRNTPLDDIVSTRIDDPYRFEAGLDEVAAVILGKPPAIAAPGEQLRRDLELVVREAPGLRVMVDRLLESQELTEPQFSSFTVAEQERHEAEFALNTLHDLMPAGSSWRFKIALVSAWLFRRYEVAYEVIERQVLGEPMDAMHVHWLFNQLEYRRPGPASVEAVLRLFEQAVSRFGSAPDEDVSVDEQFADFVKANFDQFNATQVQRAIGAAMAPSRGPGKVTAYLSFELFKRLPDSTALQSQWFHWVNAGAFFGTTDVEYSMRPESFFELMDKAGDQKLLQFKKVMDDFDDRFLAHAKHGGERELMVVARILDAANKTRYHRRQRLAAQLLQSIDSGQLRKAQNEHGRLISAIWDYAEILAHDPEKPPRYRLLTRIREGSNFDYTPGLRELGILEKEH